MRVSSGQELAEFLVFDNGSGSVVLSDPLDKVSTVK
jgi:hypothetical protein